MNEQSEVRWTNKLPALAAGMVLILIGLLATARGRIMVGVIALALGAGFVGYSLTIKDWCEIRGGTWGQSGFSQAWGGGFGLCLKQKGWMSF